MQLEKIVTFLLGSRRASGGCLPRCSPALAIIVSLFLLLLLAAAPGVGSAFGFAAATVSSTSAKAFAPTSATPREFNAYKAFQSEFPRWLAEDHEVFFIQSKNGSSVLTHETRALCSRLQAGILNLGSPALIAISSYYSALDDDLRTVSNQYLATDHRSMVVLLQIDTSDATEASKLVKHGIELGEKLDSDGHSVILTGRLTTAAVDKKSTGLGFALGDGIGLPFIIIVFVLQVGSCKLMLIPAFALSTSLIFSYAVGHALCAVLRVPEFQPNIMLFLCLAFSIDYSFFMLTRFQEERLENGQTLEASVVVMLRYGGGVVAVSGALLVLTWLALAFFPVNGLDAIGYCSAISVLLCMIANLCIAPCMLLAFPDFFSGTRGCCRGGGCCGRGGKAEATAKAPALTGILEGDHAAPLVQSQDTQESSERWHNCYFKLARALTRPPYSVFALIAIYGLFAWGASPLSHLSLSLGVQFKAGDSATAKAFTKVQATEPFKRNGIFATPFAILARDGRKANRGRSIFTDEYFSATCHFASSLMHVSGIVPYSVQGISFSVGAHPPKLEPELVCRSVAEARALVNKGNAEYRYALARTLSCPCGSPSDANRPTADPGTSSRISQTCRPTRRMPSSSLPPHQRSRSRPTSIPSALARSSS